MSPANLPKILVVDDSPAIHEDYRKILAPPPEAPALAFEAELLGRPVRSRVRFHVDCAYQGQEALERVRAASEGGRAYALAFVDMRMPPGWDGMETVQRLWKVDPRLQVVICTAYSDHPWEELVDRLDVGDRLFILKKPFDMIEVGQLARALTTKWALAREAEDQAREQARMLARLQASERDLRSTTEQLRAFGHSVSHDLQMPLAMIDTFVELLAGELARANGPPKASKYLHFIRSGAATSRQIVTGLMTLTGVARAELDLQAVDLGAMARELLAELRATSPQRVLQASVPDGLTAHCDPQLIRIAMRNLVENAWKFSSRRVQAEIEFGLSRRDADEAVFFVRDNGCGFEMRCAGELFQTFKRLHGEDEFPGSGVGLATVHRVLLRHGGRVWADSSPGGGSTFYFSLPGSPKCQAT